MRLFINLLQFAAALSESIQQQSRETQGPEHVFHNQLNRETRAIANHVFQIRESL